MVKDVIYCKALRPLINFIFLKIILPWFRFGKIAANGGRLCEGADLEAQSETIAKLFLSKGG